MPELAGVGVNPQHVTEWKKGRNLPSAESALVMLKLIKTKAKKLANGVLAGNRLAINNVISNRVPVLWCVRASKYFFGPEPVLGVKLDRVQE